MSIESLRAALSDRYTIERELGTGGMATCTWARSQARSPGRGEGAEAGAGGVFGAGRFLAEIVLRAANTL